MRAFAALTVAALVSVAPSQAWADPDWVLVAQNNEDTVTIYVDRNSIHRTGAFVRSWHRMDFVNDQKGWRQSISLKEDNCQTGQNRGLQTTVHFIDGHTDTDGQPTEWLYVTPESVIEAYHQFVCGK